VVLKSEDLKFAHLTPQFCSNTQESLCVIFSEFSLHI